MLQDFQIFTVSSSLVVLCLTAACGDSGASKTLLDLCLTDIQIDRYRRWLPAQWPARWLHSRLASVSPLNFRMISHRDAPLKHSAKRPSQSTH
ncbi:hypothetical protein BKA93DRAFT_85851 [Sparassis latifolia]